MYKSRLDDICGDRRLIGTSNSVETCWYTWQEKPRNLKTWNPKTQKTKNPKTQKPKNPKPETQKPGNRKTLYLLFEILVWGMYCVCGMYICTVHLSYSETYYLWTQRRINVKIWYFDSIYRKLQYYDSMRFYRRQLASKHASNMVLCMHKEAQSLCQCYTTYIYPLKLRKPKTIKHWNLKTLKP